MKNHLAYAPVVSFLDYSLPFCLYTDVSLTAIGAFLAQVRANKEPIIAYASCTLLPTEKNYPAMKQECHLPGNIDTIVQATADLLE